MIKDFTMLNGNVYAISQRSTDVKLFTDSISANTVVKYPDRKEIIINTSIDLRPNEVILNQDLYEMAKNILIDDKVTEVKTLTDKYRIFVEYELREDNGSMVHGGIRIMDADVTNGFQVIPVSDDNSINTVHQKQFGCILDIPVIRKKIGIMFPSPSKELDLYINNIKIVANVLNDCDTFDRYWYNHKNGVGYTSLSDTPATMQEGEVTIYDSTIHEGISSNSYTRIDSSMKSISYRLEVTMDGIFSINNYDEFISILEENKKPDTPTHPIEPPITDTDDDTPVVEP